MIYICPFVADVEGSDADLYAALNEDQFLGFFRIDANNKVEKFKNKFNLKGFYLQEAKDMWTERFAPKLQGIIT